MKRRTLYGGLVGVLVAVLVLTACGQDNPAPPQNAPVLGGFESMPKQLATIVLTETPTPVIAAVETVDVLQPTATSGAPRPTATMTPYVGVFLGEPTTEGGGPAPTLAPYVVNSGVTSGVVVNSGPVPQSSGACTAQAAAVFANAYNTNATVQSRLGCPISGGASIAGMGAQAFERGNMFWRGDTRQIYALASSGQFWQMADTWSEGMPADDPAYSPPSGLIQPVRGFGLVWRSNAGVRDALGWGTQGETQYDGFWQDFERGAMLLGPNGLAYALFTAESQHSGPLSP